VRRRCLCRAAAGRRDRPRVRRAGARAGACSGAGDGADGKEAHSLHAYFLRGGREGAPIQYRIARDFDGRSFSNGRVVASQENDEGIAVPILNLTASFQLPEDGLEHSDSPMPGVPRPDDLRSDMDQRREIAAQWGDRLSDQQRRMMLRPRPIEMRTTDRLHWMSSEPREPRAHSWFRVLVDVQQDRFHRGFPTGGEDDRPMRRAVP
jgi:acyl-CoA thioesterase-2